MNPQQPGQPGAAQQQVRIPMYRPEQMRTLEILSDSDKEKYERGLRGLWDAMENNDATSTAHIQARAKIAEFSRMVYTKVANMRRATQAQGNQPGQAGQIGQGQNPALAAQRAAAAAQQRPGAMPANAPKPAVNGGVAAAAGQQRPVAPPGAQTGISQQVLQHVNSLRIVPPPSIAGDPEKAQAFKTETKTRYIRALQLMEQATKKMQHMQNIVNQRNAKGNPLTPDEQQKFAQEMEASKKSHADAKKYVEGIRHQSQEALRQEAAAGQAAGQTAGQAARPAPQPAGNPMQAATASVNAAMDAAKNLQSGAANRATAPTPQTPSTSGPAAPAAQTTAPSAPAHPAPAPQTQVKVEPGTHPQPPPPVNTALAAASAGQHAASVGTPTQNSARVQTPQIATPTTAGPAGAARPLSHQAAMSLANRQSTNSVPTVSQPGSAGAGQTTPGAGGATVSTPQGGHSHAHPTPTAGAMHVSKMPIPKVLPEKAIQIPQPVATAGGVQPGRPTLGSGVGMSGGTMNQPVIQKNPAYTFETEGEHVMNKKKLDELVRQVCGGPPGQDGNYLTPDVEEVCLLPSAFV